MASQAQPPFAGNAALIFGGAKGIGKAVAAEWARRGAAVAVADIDEGAAQATADEIVAAGGKAVGLAANVLSEESIAQAADKAEAALGELHIVMNNVGGMLNGHPEDIPIAEWHRIMEINYFAAVRGVKHFLPRFIARGSGHIVNIASAAGLVAPPLVVPYAATKHAVVGLSTGLRPEAALHGVRVSVLCPGAVETAILDRLPPDDLPATASAPVTAREYMRRVRQKPVPADRFARAAPLDEVHPVMDLQRLNALIRGVRDIRVEPSVRNYVVAIVRATREHATVRLGASPRATLALFHAAQALAAIKGRTFVVPDDVKALVGPVLGHRLLLTSQARLRGRSELSVLDEVVASTAVPVE